MKSWRSSILGILILISVVSTQLVNILDADPSTVFNWESIAAALAGVGLLFTADHTNTNKGETQ